MLTHRWALSITELVLVAIAAMLSPTTLSFSILALVLGERPLRTGFFFYLGARRRHAGGRHPRGVRARRRRCLEARRAAPRRGLHLRHRRRRATPALGRGEAPAAARPEEGGEHGRPDEQGRLLAGDRDRRRGRGAREPRGLHPDRAEDDLADRTRPRPATRRQWIAFTLVSLLPLLDRAHPARRRARLGDAPPPGRAPLADAQRADRRRRDHRRARRRPDPQRDRRA